MNKETRRAYYQRSEIKAKQQQYRKKWCQVNKETRRAYYQRWYQANKEKVRAYYQRSDIKAKRQEYRKKWYQDNKEKKLKLQSKNNDWQKMLVVVINKLVDDYPTVNITHENQKIWKPYL